jgi:hypothetical protein
VGLIERSFEKFGKFGQSAVEKFCRPSKVDFNFHFDFQLERIQVEKRQKRK